MCRIRNDSRKSFKKDDKKDCLRAQILVFIYLMSFIQNIYFLNHFDNVFNKCLYDQSHSSAVHGRMGAVRNDSRKPFKNDDKRTANELKYEY
jgi:hypothetical protein